MSGAWLSACGPSVEPGSEAGRRAGATGARLSAVIGPEGGDLRGEVDGWRVAVGVAPGAVEAPVVFTVAPASGAYRGVLGQAFELGPSRAFAEPVRVEIEAPAENPPVVRPTALRLATSHDGETWEALPLPADTPAGVRGAAGLASHFSLVAIVPAAPDEPEYLCDQIGSSFSLAGFGLTSSEVLHLHSMQVSATWIDYLACGSTAACLETVSPGPPTP